MADLSCVVGIGSALWDRLFDGPRPVGLHPFCRIARCPAHRGRDAGRPAVPPAGPPDGPLLRAGPAAGEPARRLRAQVVDEVHGFKYFDERDLLGFVDGTENPTGAAAVTTPRSIGDEDPDFAGGSYVIVQKYLHDLTRWNALPVEEQERVIGRTKLDDIELPDDVKPSNSHVALNTITDDDGEERQIVRDNMPFGERR